MPKLLSEIKWGFVGCGDVTEIKSGPAFNKIEYSEVVAVMRRDGAKAKDYALRHGIPKWYDDADRLINDPEVNAVYIATPPSSHAEYTIKAAEAGKPVYVEKPMAAGYNECNVMLDACNKNDVLLFVAYYRRQLPLFLKVKEIIKSGEIGHIQNVNIRLLSPPSPKDYDIQNLPWRVIPEIAGAGYFYDLASHQFDYLDYLFGSIKNVTGYKSNKGGFYSAEDNVTASFEFDNGILGCGVWSFNAPEDKDEFEIIGSNGMIKFSTFAKFPIRVVTNKGSETIKCDFPDHVHQPLLQTVVNELRGEGICPSNGISGARTNRVMDKILGKI
jgi:predicted dehydrogenase